MDFKDVKTKQDIQNFLINEKLEVWQYYDICKQLGEKEDNKPFLVGLEPTTYETLKYDIDEIIKDINAEVLKFSQKQKNAGVKYDASEHICYDTLSPLLIHEPKTINHEEHYSLLFDLYLGTNGYEGKINNSLELLKNIIDVLSEKHRTVIRSTFIDNADDVYDFLIQVEL